MPPTTLVPRYAVVGVAWGMSVEGFQRRLRKKTRMSGTAALAGRCFALLRGRHAWGMQFVLKVGRKRFSHAERVWIGDGLLWNTVWPSPFSELQPWRLGLFLGRFVPQNKRALP